MTAALVVFATRNGSTEAVAEAIAATLRSPDATVDLLPVSAVRPHLDHLDLVVVGAPLYSGRWSRDALRFLKRHRAELSNVPVAVFALGPRDDSPDSWQRSRSQLDRALAKRTWLSPIATAVFGGVDPPDKKLHRDLRDWDDIRGWASQLASRDRPAPAE